MVAPADKHAFRAHEASFSGAQHVGSALYVGYDFLAFVLQPAELGLVVSLVSRRSLLRFARVIRRSRPCHIARRQLVRCDHITRC
jgi:hypothetical protein